MTYSDQSRVIYGMILFHRCAILIYRVQRNAQFIAVKRIRILYCYSRNRCGPAVENSSKQYSTACSRYEYYNVPTRQPIGCINNNL